MRRLSRSRLLLATGFLLGVVILALLAACADKRGADASAPAAASPQDAIGVYVENTGERYAGLCEQTRSPDDIGKVCSKLIETPSGLEAHLIGRTFSEYATWVFVGQHDGGWNVVATAQLDFLDTTGAIPWPR